MKKYTSNFIWFSSITIYSVLVFTVLLGNKDTFYVDDNLMQWGPIIKKGFDQIFSGGGIPYWNFYQYKGLDVFSSGYYGFLNPFMYISYIISRYMFNYNIETLIIYEWIMYWLGLLVMRKLFHDLSLKFDTIIISLFTYSVSIIYFSHAFYYFTFNNYFFIPLLLYAVYRIRMKIYIWFIPGILLAFSLLLGHVQYTCYYIIVYCVMQFVFSIQKQKLQVFIPITSNLIIFFILSAFILSLSLSVSDNRNIILSDLPSDFLSEPIYIHSILFPISLAPILKFVSRHEMEQYVGLGMYTYLALVPLIPLIKKISFRFYKLFKKFDDKYLSSQEYSKHILYKNVIISALYFSAIKLYFNSIFPFHVYTELIFDIILLIIVIIGPIISIKNTKKFFLSQHSIFVAFFMFTSGLLLFLPFVSYVILFVYYIYKCRKKIFHFTYNQLFFHAVAFSAFFFIIMGSGRENIIAYILSFLPAIKDFRFLYKCSFIYVPQIIICGAISLNTIKHRTLLIKSISVICSLTSFISIIYIVYSGIHPYYNNSYYDYHDYRTTESNINSQIEKLAINPNYRFVAFINPKLLTTASYVKPSYYSDHPIPFWLSLDPDVIYNRERKDINTTNLNNSIEVSSKICTYVLSKNLATCYNVYSLNGYDNIFSEKNFNQSNQIMNDIYLEGMMSNLSLQLNTLSSKQSTGELDLFQEQMINNSVKYVIMDDTSTQQFRTIINGCERLSIEREVPWYKNFVLLEINGVNSICTDMENTEIPFASTLSSLCFRTNYTDTQQVNISMTYNPNYILQIISDNNTAYNIPVEESQNGFVQANIPAGNNTIKLIYKNRKMDIAVILAILTSILSLMSVITISRTDFK